MRKRRGERVWAPKPPGPPTPAEKQAIIAACEHHLETFLRPRFLPRIVPATSHNYVIAICGTWHGRAYRFGQIYRSVFDNRIADTFEAPFARLVHTGPDRFDLFWLRHTGKWWPMHRDVTLDQAMDLLRTVTHLRPVQGPMPPADEPP